MCMICNRGAILHNSAYKVLTHFHAALMCFSSEITSAPNVVRLEGFPMKYVLPVRKHTIFCQHDRR